jgi:hypothetical protein
MLLSRFPARGWEELRTRNGTVFGCVSEAPLAVPLVGDVNQNARICLFDAMRLERPPGDLRFLVILLVRNGASFDLLCPEFVEVLADAGDSEIDVSVKLEALMDSFIDPPLDHELVPPVSKAEAVIWDELNDEQKVAADAILGAVMDKSAQLMFLEGSAGTGKTFLVRHLLDTLRSRGTRCIVCATTGIAAVQYEGGVTMHALFKLGIDECSHDRFVSNSGRETPRATFLLSAQWIVIDEVSMLTRWVADRVSRVLNWLAEVDGMFGGVKRVFGGICSNCRRLSRISAWRSGRG